MSLYSKFQTLFYLLRGVVRLAIDAGRPRREVRRHQRSTDKLAGKLRALITRTDRQDAAANDMWHAPAKLAAQVDQFDPSSQTAPQRLRCELDFLTAQIDLLKSKLELPAAAWHELLAMRRTPTNSEVPLVSVCIATRNRVKLLIERSLPSVLNQTYRNLEVIVVADGCTDGTGAAVAALGDERVRFHAIDHVHDDVGDSVRRWMISGSRPNNVGQGLANGDYVTHLDDDDEHVLDRVEKLLAFIRRQQADLVFHPFWAEAQDGKWALNSAEKLGVGRVTTSSIFYRRWIKHLTWDVDTHLLGEPADWNRIRRIIYAGGKCVRYPEPLLRHYRERNQPSTQY